MKGLFPLFLGLFGTFAFSWVGLIMIPNFQIGHLDPQMDEEGADVYPAPNSGLAERGRKVYVANGCNYCHSEWLRADYAASDIDRTRDFEPRQKWGERRSAPRDYIFSRPVALGKTRMGPDLANIGKSSPPEEESPSPTGSPSPAGLPAAPVSPAGAASPAKAGASPAASAPSPAASGSPAAPPAKPSVSPASAASVGSKPVTSPAAAVAPPGGANPAPVAQTAGTAANPAGVESNPGEPAPYSAAWHHRHLYSPRSITLDSNMPAYRFLYEKRRFEGEPSADAVKLTGSDAPPVGWEIVPTYDATCLVAYLMSLNQSHPLKEVKAAASAASSPAAATSPAPAAPPPPAASASPPAASPAKRGQ
jgi:cbb3-type cytochrome oxidase cytochrome c subunit